jgi:hypothetical protein
MSPPATLTRTGMLLLSPVAYHAPGIGLLTSTASRGGACGSERGAGQCGRQTIKGAESRASMPAPARR